MNYKGVLKRQTFIIVFSFLALVIAIAGASYALFFSMNGNTEDNIVKAGDLEVNFGSSSETIAAEMVPMSDADGMAQDGYTFSVTNTGTLPGKYYLSVYNNTTGVSDLSSFLDHSMLRISVDGNEPQTLSEVQHTEETLGDTNQNTIHYEVLSNVIIEVGATNNHTIRLWINEEADTDIIGKKIRLKIEAVSIVADEEEMQYADASGAERPELDNGLIPVVYEDNKWKKADTTQQWYDYDTQWWANAVTVKEANRSTYTSAAAGTEIPMSAINTMWVWIPRYEYQTNNLTYIENGTIHNQYAGGSQTEPGAININFVPKETITSSAENFFIHPAFTFGEEDLSGIWVAKFKMSTGDNTCTATINSVETGCDLQTIKPTIIPNVTSWRGARVGTYFTAIQNQMNGSSGTTTYGITNSDTHMMKNMEWGAAAYLSQSKYGKYGNASYMGTDKEVYRNTSLDYITGNGNEVAYNVEGTGTGASTTGNIYGIYDMNAGAREHVMGVMKESTNTEVAVGYSSLQNSGFSGKLFDGTDFTGAYGALKDIDTKYYDIYDYGIVRDDITAYGKGHLGDATRETAGWYRDNVYFVGYCDTWFIRGGDYYDWSGSGVFYFSASYGSAYNTYSARPVLVSAAN